MIAEVVEALRPLAPYLVPLVWFGFFAGAIVAIHFHRSDPVRRAFIASFFIGLLFFATISPVVLLPFVQWHKFSEPWPTEVENHQMRVVDEHGEELVLDNRLTLGFEGIRMSGLNQRMVAEFDQTTNERIAAHLLDRAAAYRADLRSPSPTRYLRFPPHGITSTWTDEQVDAYGEFVGIRIYRLTITTSEDGSEVVEYEETLLLEVFPEEGANLTSEEANAHTLDAQGPSVVCHARGVATAPCS